MWGEDHVFACVCVCVWRTVCFMFVQPDASSFFITRICQILFPSSICWEHWLTDHRRPKWRWHRHHLHVLHMFRLKPAAVPSGRPLSVPNTLYLSVSLLFCSHTSPVHFSPGLVPYFSPSHAATVNLQKPPPPGSGSFFIKMHSDWQETYLHIKLTST